MIWQAQCYPTCIDDLKPVLELAARLGADHVNLQPNVRPYRLQECIPYLEGWRRLADEAGIAVHVETHRDHDHRPVLHPAIARLLFPTCG